MMLLVILGALVLAWFICLLILLVCLPYPQPLPSLHGLPKRNLGIKKNLLLVIAHPDDESMFFAPTLLSLDYLGCYNVRIVCLSNGNAEGLGITRMQELMSACSVFNVPMENIEILNHPDLQDGHNMIWNLDLIVEELKRLISVHNIEAMITFDNYGISGHPNHISVYRGVCAYLLSCIKNHATQNCIEAWSLESMNITCKYFGPISALYTMWTNRNRRDIHCFANKEPMKGIRAMRQHASQWLWYRRLFVIFSYYTYMNTLIRLDS